MSEKPSAIVHEPNSSSVENVIKGIITDNKGLFFSGDLSQFSYQVQKVYSTKMIRELNNGLLDIPQDVYHANIHVTRLDNRHTISESVDFMQLGQYIVPLGTHIKKHSTNFNVYKLNGNKDGLDAEESLSKYILNGLPDSLLLTRVLSEEEALKFAHGDMNLGSSNSIFWQDALHTAVHNITNEFENDDRYKKAVKFKLYKAELAKLTAEGSASFGTYGFVFKDRDEDSPFPFDLEAVFTRDAIPALVYGYQKWAEQAGQPYIDNPFYYSPKS